MWQYWLIASGIFFVCEIVTVGFLLFWFGIAGLITMVVSLFTSNIIIQSVVFLVTSVILILSTKPFVKKFVNKETIVTNANSLIGKKAIVIQEINNLQGTGQLVEKFGLLKMKQIQLFLKIKKSKSLKLKA